MPLPCEFAVKAIIPAFRALIAKELIEYYQLKQENVADLLGVTQPAISQYTRNVRGKTLDLDKIESIRVLAKGLAANLVNNSLSLKEINQKYCAACITARKKRIICELHKQRDPYFNTEECDACQIYSC